MVLICLVLSTPLKLKTLKRLKFGLTNIKRKGYSEGVHQIENTPEVAPLDGEDVLKDSVFVVQDPASPIVIKKPLKIDDGSSTISPKILKDSIREDFKKKKTEISDIVHIWV